MPAGPSTRRTKLLAVGQYSRAAALGAGRHLMSVEDATRFAFDQTHRELCSSRVDPSDECQSLRNEGATPNTERAVVTP